MPTYTGIVHAHFYLRALRESVSLEKYFEALAEAAPAILGHFFGTFLVD